MSKNDSKPDSDSDWDWNAELLHAILKKQGKSKPITEKDRIERIRECLDEGAHVNTVDTNKNTALHIAVKKRYKEVAQFLIEKGADVYVENKNGYTALTLAETLGDKDFVSYSQLYTVWPSALQPRGEITSFNQGPSTSRDNFSPANDISLKYKGQTLKRKCTTDNEDNENSNQRRCTSPDINPKKMLGFDKDEIWTASGIKRSLHGIIYQLKLLMLVLQRGVREGHTFRLAAEIEEIEKFDDLMLQYIDKTEGRIVYRVLQVKHRHTDTKAIGTKDLLDGKHAEFSLLKYFISYRKIKRHPNLCKSKLKDCIIWTNIGLDVNNLESAKIYPRKDVEPDNIFDIESPPCPATRYKLVANEGSRLYEILQTASDVHILAETLAEYVFRACPIRLSSDIIARYHTALAVEVINVEERRFSANFINNKDLSDRAKNFRKIFVSNFSKYVKWPKEDTFAMWKIVCETELKLSAQFGKPFCTTDLAFANPKKILEEFVKLFKHADNENLITIDRKHQVIDDDIRKLAGHVLVVAEGERIYKFNSQFFDDGHKQPGIINELKNLLKAHLGNEYNHLDRYRFKINNFPYFKENNFQKQFELPNDNIIVCEEIADFLDKLVLAVNQPNEFELGIILTRELAAQSEFNLHNADLVWNSFQNEMLDWFKTKDGVFLTNEDGKAIFKSVRRKLNTFVCSGLSLSYLVRIKEYGIEFEDEIQELKKFLMPNSDPIANKSVLHLITKETLLTAIRVHQSIREIKIYEKDDSLIFVPLGTLLLPEIEDRVVRAFDWRQSQNLLVIECESANEKDLQRLCNRLHCSMMENSAKKLILITKCEGKQSSIHIENCEEQRDEVSFNDLTKVSRQILLGKPVINFQGQMGMCLEKLLKIHSSEQIKSNKSTDFESMIDSSTLIKLIRNEEIKVGDDLKELDGVADPYVNRTINRQIFLKSDILKQLQISDANIRDIFVISGIDREGLERLVEDKEKIQSFHEIDWQKMHSYKFIILSNEQEKFEILCEKYSEYNVHWLKSESKKLIWKESRGNIINLLPYRDLNEANDNDNHVDEATARYLKDDELAVDDERHGVVIISATAGMGKTTLFTHLARKIIQKKSGIWVIRIELKEFIEALEQEKKKMEGMNQDVQGRVIEFFVEKLSNLKTDLEKNILKAVIKNHGSIALLFDGFDEVCPDYEETVINLLQTFKKLGVKKLFVSTRPHMAEALEKKLGVFCYTMKPFSKENRINFLIRYWQARLDIDDLEPRIKDYAEALIKIVSKSIQDGANKFAGIPLQTRMIAEIFQGGRDGRVGDFETCHEFLRSTNDKPRLPRKMNIVDLYRHFVDQKHDIYYTEKFKAKFTITDFYEASHEEIFLKMHQKLALFALFNAEDLNMLLNQQGTESLRKQMKKITHERTGIITHIIGDKPQFIHHSFAEYFTAIFFVEILMKDHHNPKMPKFIVEQILLRREYNITRVFLNQLLQVKSSLLNDHYEDKATDDSYWKLALAMGRNTLDQTIFHVAAQEHNYEIIKIFLNRFGSKDETSKFLNETKDRSDQTVLYVTALNNHWDGLKLLVELGGAGVNCPNSSGETPLHWAALSGDLPMVEWLVDNEADLHAESLVNQKPVHWAALSGKLEVLEWLIDKTEVDVNSLMLDKEMSNSPLAVFQWLVEEKNANFKGINDCGKSVLYTVTFWGRVDIVEWLVKDKDVKLEHEADGGTELIRRAVCENHWGIVKCLIESSVFDIVAEDIVGSSILGCAIERAPLNDIKWLVKKKDIDVNATIINGDALVHSAVAHGRLDVMQWLVAEKRVDPWRTDGNGGTLLHKAAVGGYLNIIQSLVESDKRKVSHTDNDNRTALDVYCEHHPRNRSAAILHLLQRNTYD